MSELEPWPCWACSKEIEGSTYQAFSLTQRWKEDRAREGSYTRVALCMDCGRRVMGTLYAIQDEAAPTGAAPGATDG